MQHSTVHTAQPSKIISKELSIFLWSILIQPAKNPQEFRERKKSHSIIWLNIFIFISLTTLSSSWGDLYSPCGNRDIVLLWNNLYCWLGVDRAGTGKCSFSQREKKIFFFICYEKIFFSFFTKIHNIQHLTKTKFSRQQLYL